MITDEQYQAVKPIFEAMCREGGGAVDVDEFIARIEGEPGISALFFDADQDQIYRRYQLERARAFIQLWALKEAKHIIGVATRVPRLVCGDQGGKPSPTIYRPIEHAWSDEATAQAAKRFFRHGLGEVRDHAPYCLAWGQSYESLCAEVQEVLAEICGQMSTAALAAAG